MSDTEYTPTFEELRDMVGAASFMLGGRGTDQLYGKFDRALAAHDAELTERVRAEQIETDIDAVVGCNGRYGTRNYREDNYASGAGDALADAVAAIREAGKDA